MSSNGAPPKVALPQGPPFAPQYHSMGGKPVRQPDIAPTSFFLGFYVIFAIIHFTTMKRNEARHHKFPFSGAMFGFCQIRVVTMCLRIASACHNTSLRLAIAAQLFVYIGTVLLFIMNWFFAQRVFRAQHPHLGWTATYRVLHGGSLIGVIIALLLLLVACVGQFFVRDHSRHAALRMVQLIGQTYFAVFSSAPIVVVMISRILPRKYGVDKFGTYGRLRNTIRILVVSSLVLAFGAIFRCAASFITPVSLRDSNGKPTEGPWYFSKACFYFFNFATEAFVVFFYAIVRFDRRFHIPNGANRPWAYTAGYMNQFRSREQDSEDDHSVGNCVANSRLHYHPPMEAAQRPPDGAPSTLTMNDDRAASPYDIDVPNSSHSRSSILALDSKSGNWTLKNLKARSSVIRRRREEASTSSVCSTEPLVAENASDAPPVPDFPDWPLRDHMQPNANVLIAKVETGDAEPESTQGKNAVRIDELQEVDLTDTHPVLRPVIPHRGSSKVSEKRHTVQTHAAVNQPVPRHRQHATGTSGLREMDLSDGARDSGPFDPKPVSSKSAQRTSSLSAATAVDQTDPGTAIKESDTPIASSPVTNSRSSTPITVLGGDPGGVYRQSLRASLQSQTASLNRHWLKSSSLSSQYSSRTILSYQTAREEPDLSVSPGGGSYWESDLLGLYEAEETGTKDKKDTEEAANGFRGSSGPSTTRRAGNREDWL